MKDFRLTLRKDRPIFRVTITADMNDGDYLTNIDEYSKEGFESGLADELYRLSKIVGVWDALSKFEEEYHANIPFDTQSGEPCHTLESLTIEYIDEHGQLFDFEFVEEES